MQRRTHPDKRRHRLKSLWYSLERPFTPDEFEMQTRNAVSPIPARAHYRQHRSAVVLAAQFDKAAWRNIKTGKYRGAKLTDILGYTLLLNGKFALVIKHSNPQFNLNRIYNVFD